MDDTDDGYAGPATLTADDASLEVQVRLAGQFDPISGSYHWYGRVSGSPELAQWAGRRVTLRTPHGAADTTLTDLDPWGRPRVEGFGTAPFEVLDSLA